MPVCPFSLTAFPSSAQSQRPYFPKSISSVIFPNFNFSIGKFLGTSSYYSTIAAPSIPDVSNMISGNVF